MLNDNINYPYPVIRSYNEDYISTVFEGNLSVRIVPDGYAVHPAFEINNDDIQKLIAEGFLKYALEIQCVSTWFRKLYIVEDNSIIKLDTSSIHERVELIPCIVAAKTIDDFSNYDFSEEYEGITYPIKPGDVIGIGERRVFDALYQNDIIKDGSSIVQIDGSDSDKVIKCNFSNSEIKITLPKDQFEKYTECGYSKTKYKTLNAVIVVPALVEGIGIIRDDDKNPDKTSGYEGKAWYKTIVANLKRYAENDEGRYRNMLDNPFSSAEILLANNSAAALDLLCNIN